VLIFKTLLVLVLTSIGYHTIAQSPVDSVLGKINPDKWSADISKRIDRIDEKLTEESIAALQRSQSIEEEVFRTMLSGKDPLPGKLGLQSATEKYQSLLTKLQSPIVSGSARHYIPGLDSLTTSLKFLDQHAASVPVKDALAKAQSLESRFQQAEEVKKFIRDRKEQLQTQLQNLGLTKELKKLNKQAYYYSAQVQEYKNALNDPDKAFHKAMGLLNRTHFFQDFLKRNSLLASIFKIPSSEDDLSTVVGNSGGLQTTSQVNSFIRSQFGNLTPDLHQQFQQNISEVQSAIQQLKNKIGTSGGSSDDAMPNFKPNNQKVKSFAERLEYGFNIQARRAQYYFPQTNDIALSLGYRLNDRSVIGVGLSYKLGLGTGWSHIHFTQQGAGLRSYLDWTLKGNFWITGGFEMNYYSTFSSITQLKQYNAWQPSGLIGLSKKYSLGKKAKGKVQLLWDFLSSTHSPPSPAIVFRTGYDFK